MFEYLKIPANIKTHLEGYFRLLKDRKTSRSINIELTGYINALYHMSLITESEYHLLQNLRMEIFYNPNYTKFFFCIIGQLGKYALLLKIRKPNFGFRIRVFCV